MSLPERPAADQPLDEWWWTPGLRAAITEIQRIPDQIVAEIQRLPTQTAAAFQQALYPPRAQRAIARAQRANARAQRRRGRKRHEPAYERQRLWDAAHRTGLDPDKITAGDLNYELKLKRVKPPYPAVTGIIQRAGFRDLAEFRVWYEQHPHDAGI
jgi:hypothetical protein